MPPASDGGSHDTVVRYELSGSDDESDELNDESATEDHRASTTEDGSAASASPPVSAATLVSGTLLPTGVDLRGATESRQRERGDPVRVIGAQLATVTRSDAHLSRLRDGVERVHRATVLASELLNLHLRRLLEANEAADLPNFFDGNWTKQAWTAVTAGNGRVDAALAVSRTVQITLHGAHVLPPISTAGLDQMLKFEADKFATTAATNVWLHLRKRVKRYVNLRMALSDAEYNVLTKEQKAERGKQKKKVVWDVCRVGSEPCASAEAHHSLVQEVRQWLGWDAIEWDEKPLEYHAKADPRRFLRASWKLLGYIKAVGGRGFSLLPLRSTMRPGYATVDTNALRWLLGVGRGDAQKAAYAANKAKRQKLADDDPAKNSRAKKRTPQEMEVENWEVWDGVFEFSKVLRGELCGLHPRNRRQLYFGFSMSTDGVGCSLKFTLPGKAKDEAGKEKKKKKKPDDQPKLTAWPTKGLWTVDQLKHLARQARDDFPMLPCDSAPQEAAAELDKLLGNVQVIGVDPGKVELAVAADAGVAAANGRKIRTVRYTAAQRRAETAQAHYHLKAKHRDDPTRTEKARLAQECAAFLRTPANVLTMERSLAGTDAKTPTVAGFGAYVTQRAAVLLPLLEHYAAIQHRRSRWHVRRESERSVAKFIARLSGMKRDGKDHLVVAWGAWGAVAGRPGQACNKGNAPAIGVGLMKRVAKELPVVLTPEYFTSQLSSRDGGKCGRHRKVEQNRLRDHPTWRNAWTGGVKEIRGLRLSNNSEIARPLNRDANAAVNIGVNGMRLLYGLGAIKAMSDEDVALLQMDAAVATQDA